MLIDLEMPDKDGLALATEIRRGGGLNDTSMLILISAAENRRSQGPSRCPSAPPQVACICRLRVAGLRRLLTHVAADQTNQSPMIVTPSSVTPREYSSGPSADGCQGWNLISVAFTVVPSWASCPWASTFTPIFRSATVPPRNVTEPA